MESSNKRVASFTDAWIETKGMRLPFSSAWSHLLQMRGLKREYRDGQNPEPLSHLLQMRGLKQKRGATSTGTQEVASFTDAWIETN